MKRRQRPRRGRLLERVESASVVDACRVSRDLHRTLTARGYKLIPTTRPYLNANGDMVTLRFVWRHRAAGESVTIRFNSRLKVH